MKRLMITAAMLATMCASAATVEELNVIPAKDVTAANASEVLDAAIATTNSWKIRQLVTFGKVSLEDAVHKTMTLKPLSMCNAAFNGSTATNHALQAEALAQLDYTKLAENDFMGAREILMKNAFFMTEAGLAEAARIAEVSVPYGAMVYCTAWTANTKKAFAGVAPEFYAKAKPYVKSSGSSFFMQAMIWYGFYVMKDYDGLSEIYSKDLLTTSYTWLQLCTVNPSYTQYMKDVFAMWKAAKPDSIRDKMLVNFAKTIDRANGNIAAMSSIVDLLSTSKLKLNAALQCKDIDKVIEVLVTCDTSLAASDIEKALAPLNSLDPDYKTADVLKALRAINQRYTLKLYDDRDAWEPVLSKVRAMIDCR